MNTKNNIKKRLLEVAGISFEVRTWAQIIENYVNDYVKAEKEKIKSQTPVTPTTQPTSRSWSATPDDDEDYNEWRKTRGEEEKKDDFSTEFTHFESHNGEKYDSALVYGQELYINADVLDEFPTIENIIRSRLFEVDLDGEGEFSIDTVGSTFPDHYLYGILEIIKDHMVMGRPFYNNNYDEVFATVDDEYEYANYYNYMNEGNGYSYQGGYYGGYSYTPQPKIDKIEIDGKQFPEAYKDFSVDKWVITSSNRIEYDHWKSGYEGDQYVVYLNMPMYSVGGSALIHEVKHAYDDWNRMRKGAQPIRAGWEIKNIYTPDFEKLVLGGSFKISPMLHPIIRYYYLGSKLETPAYLENEYDSPVMGSYRDTAKKMMNFKASNFLDKKGNPAKGLQESWTGLIADYDIPFFRKFKNVVDFLNYTERHFNKRGRDILRRIDKMKYVHGKPMTTQAPPKFYVKPEPTEPKTQSNLPKEDVWEKLNAEIDKLESEWDKLYEEYLTNKDPKKRRELDELDKIINEKLFKLNNMNKNDLPF